MLSHSMFSEQPLVRSKEDIIARLNQVTTSLNERTQELRSAESKKLIESLFTVTSINDPYQFNNMRRTIDDINDSLSQKLHIELKRTGACSAVFALSYLAMTSMEKPPVGLVFCMNALLFGYEGHAIHQIRKEIKTLNKIEKIIERNSPDNTALANILTANPDSASTLAAMKHEREEYFEKHIKPQNMENQKADKRKTSGAFFKWSSKEGAAMGVGKATLPEAQIHLTANNSH